MSRRPKARVVIWWDDKDLVVYIEFRIFFLFWIGSDLCTDFTPDEAGFEFAQRVIARYNENKYPIIFKDRRTTK
ncbi:MAG: hypothetical protein ACTHLE_03535 [Agriterribacter sp.]